MNENIFTNILHINGLKFKVESDLEQFKGFVYLQTQDNQIIVQKINLCKLLLIG